MKIDSPAFIYSEHEFKVLSLKKSFELMHEAIRQKQIPSRKAHAMKAIESLFREPTSLALRVVDLAVNIFQLMLFPIYGDKKYLKEDFAFRICRLMILDHVAILTTLIASVNRLFFSLVGIISPKAGAYGWMGAEYLKNLHHHLQGLIWRALVQQRHQRSMNSSDFFPKPLKAHFASRYLGEKKANALKLSLKLKKISHLDKNLKTVFRAWIEWVESISKKSLHDAIIHASAYPSVYSLSLKLKTIQEESHSQFIYNRFTAEEIRCWYNFLVSYIKNKKESLRHDPEYQTRGRAVYDAINCRFDLGGVRITSYGLRPSI